MRSLVRSIAPAGLAAALLVAACDRAPTAPAAGRLVIPLYAVPAGVTATVTLRGPDGRSRALAPPDTLNALPAGMYTIAAPDIVANGTTYTAMPQEQTVRVVADSVSTAGVIVYSIATARLAITVAGLPAGAAASGTITGPAGFSRTLTTTAALDRLVPGSYTITASDVQTGGRTYHPNPATRTLTLGPSEQLVPVTVAYGAGGGALSLAVTGLPAGSATHIAVTAPSGVVQTLDGAGTLSYLEAGTYTVSAPTVGSDLVTYRPVVAVQSIDVAATGTTSATVAYNGTALDLGLARVASGLTAPVLVTAPDGDPRLFVVERDGRILLVKNTFLQSTPFLDMRDRVNSTGERGLLGVAFDPHYAANGFLYVYYVDPFGEMAVDRYRSTPGADIVTTLPEIVIRIAHGGAEHHGGTITFGPDGMLYIAPGDGGCCNDPNNHAQDLTSYLGKVLRLDVRSLPYRIPPDNPFTGQTGRVGEIWAYGLRNPWRFSFDAPAGNLYIADVGQDLREEVNVAPAAAAGRNYGWRLMEGSACFNPAENCDVGAQLTLPVLDYLHTDGCSVIGGFVYRGAQIPELAGRYLYTDYCAGWVHSFRYAAGAATEQRAWPNLASLHPVSFGRDGAGELYIVGSGTVWRVVRD